MWRNNKNNDISKLDCMSSLHYAISLENWNKTTDERVRARDDVCRWIVGHELNACGRFRIQRPNS